MARSATTYRYDSRGDRTSSRVSTATAAAYPPADAAGNQGYARIRLAVARRGATVADAKNLSDSVIALVSHASDGLLGAESALDLVRSGYTDLLVGVTESNWLECKSQPHPVDTDAGRIELAQDVARFANSNTAALLLIGPVTKRRGGQDTIVSVNASPTKHDAGRFARAIGQRVFPPIDGLVVENAPAGSGGYVLANFVPVQLEELRPFLVHGAIAGGKVEGAFISIVRRPGEETIPVRPESIHATLAAGRALLRRNGSTKESGTRQRRIPTRGRLRYLQRDDRHRPVERRGRPGLLLGAVL